VGFHDKTIHATAIMLLAQDGKLKLDDPVSRHYPNAPSAWSNVTVRHLLTHTSGIKGYTELPIFSRRCARIMSLTRSSD
jgi:CubicO group peptidase (beta-lactamase class C family)